MSKPKAKELAEVQRQVAPLMESFEFSSAEFILRTALAQWPHDPELNAHYGSLLCFTQREPEALAHLQRAGNSKNAKKLGLNLVNHFHCRHLMATKLGVKDPEGAQLLETARLIYGSPPSDVGVALSAVLIVKNEEAVLERCLSSIQDLVDEIVVVDTGSTDKTVEIAKKFGARLGSFEWRDDFAAARNAALELATGRWALWIDADETLPEAHHETIRNALVRPHFSGFDIPIVNYMSDEGTADQYVHTPTRLFQMHPSVRFVGRIHEQIAESLRALGPLCTLESARIYHEGYRPALMAEKDKLNRALTLLEAEVRENPEDSFQWFNLANALAIAGRGAEAEHACRTSIRTLTPGQPHGATAYQLMIEAMEADGRLEEALETVEEAASRDLAGIVVEFDRASILMKLGRNDEALEAVDRCLKLDWPVGFQGDYSIFTYKRHGLRGQILAVLNRLDEALAVLKSALQKNPEYVPTIYSIASVQERQGALSDALESFLALALKRGVETLCLQGAARCCIALGRPVEAVDYLEKAWRAEPANLDAWVGWVQAAEAAGDRSRVLAAYQSFVDAHEPSVEILVNWGRALEESGDSERALNCFSEALKRDPTNSNAYFNCGDLLYRLEQYADAAHLYECGLKYSPLHTQGWFVLGNAMVHMGLPEGARIAYRQCLALNPEHGEARQNMEYLAELFPQAV